MNEFLIPDFVPCFMVTFCRMVMALLVFLPLLWQSIAASTEALSLMWSMGSHLRLEQKCTSTGADGGMFTSLHLLWSIHFKYPAFKSWFASEFLLQIISGTGFWHSSWVIFWSTFTPKEHSVLVTVLTVGQNTGGVFHLALKTYLIQKTLFFWHNPYFCRFYLRYLAEENDL